ncbi:hypothetical protein GJ496_005558, partial [Pomphorhynchus laevis]
MVCGVATTQPRKLPDTKEVADIEYIETKSHLDDNNIDSVYYDTEDSSIKSQNEDDNVDQSLIHESPLTLAGEPVASPYRSKRNRSTDCINDQSKCLNNKYSSLPKMSQPLPIQSRIKHGRSTTSLINASLASKQNVAKALVILGLTKRSTTSRASRRYGFNRSEEIGVMSQLHADPFRLNYSNDHGENDGKVSCKEQHFSTNKFWSGSLTHNHERLFTNFVGELGPGQIVSRQVLGSPCLGEVRLSISVIESKRLKVEVIEAKNLVPRHINNALPAPYVKLYIMKGGNYVERYRSKYAQRSLNPKFCSTVIFKDVYRDSILQVVIWGYLGRLISERVFMGVVQLDLKSLIDEHNTAFDKLTTNNCKWYKLFCANSVITSPRRKSLSLISKVGQKDHSLKLANPDCYTSIATCFRSLLISSNSTLLTKNHVKHFNNCCFMRCSYPGDEDRMDCHPATGASQSVCLERKCCWNTPSSGITGNVPSCYYPTNYPGYALKSSALIKGGFRYYIEREERTYLPDELIQLMADLTYVSESILRLRITDRHDSRFQVPYVFNVTPIDEPIQNNFRIEVQRNPFAIKAWNRFTNEKILDTSVGPLLYADQFIEISTSLPNKYVYGLGEHRNPLRIDCSWQTIPFWNRDQPPVINHNLYGSQPMLIAPGSTSKYSYGLFMLNSNAMEVVLQPTPTITYRTIGGVIDLFIYSGPTPQDVVRQHWTVVQFPHFQPYWAMGMHLCRYGYNNISNLRTVMNRMKAVGFQYDVQWTDIDAMRDKLVFTYDNINWPGLPELVKELHDSDMRYTPINDPCIGIADPGTYPALDEGLKLDVFIRDLNGERLVGRVWPGDCYFPDFTSPNAVKWWSEQIRIFNETAPFDGFWIDMNEPANFVHGSVTGCEENNKLDYPWYTPKVISGLLYDKTVCPSAKQ